MAPHTFGKHSFLHQDHTRRGEGKKSATLFFFSLRLALRAKCRIRLAMDNRKTGFQSLYYLWTRLAHVAFVMQASQGPVYCSAGNTDLLSTERSLGKGSSWKGLLQHTDENETSALARSTFYENLLVSQKTSGRCLH